MPEKKSIMSERRKTVMVIKESNKGYPPELNLTKNLNLEGI
jgi:hypothetical protein